MDVCILDWFVTTLFPYELDLKGRIQVELIGCIQKKHFFNFYAPDETGTTQILEVLHWHSPLQVRLMTKNL